MLTELEARAQRLQQQLNAYEKLHAEELEKFQSQFAAFQRIQDDEMQMLRQQLEELENDIALLREAATKSATTHVDSVQGEMGITRRDFLTGNLRPRKNNLRT